MKCKVLNLIIIVVPIIITGCNNNEPEKISDVNHPGSLVMLLCDLTTSIDSSRTIDKALNSVNKVLTSLQSNTKYMVYPLGQTPEQCLFEDKTDDDITEDDVASSNRENFDKCLHKLRKEYESRKDRATCINEAIEAAANTIRNIQQKGGYSQITLVVVSDMLEYCMVNGVQLNFEKQPFDQAKANQVLKNWPENRKYLAGLDTVNIYVVYSTSKLVSYTLIGDFWKSVFEKAGYHKIVHPVADFQSEYLKEDKETILSERN